MSQPSSFRQELGTTRGVLIAFLLLVIVETLVVHLIVSSWSPLLDKILLFFSILTGFYLVADAVRLSASEISLVGDTLVIKNGLRGSARLPRSLITKASPGALRPEQKESFLLSPSGRSTVVLELSMPAKISGPFGIPIQARQIGIAPVDVEGFLLQLERS